MLKRLSIVYAAREAVDGAGVRLKRVFGGMSSVPFTDPFLLLDNFGSSNPEDYIMGFPWHPHRGIETVTYMLEGTVEHEDSEGNKGIIRPGELQWMTAGSGIFHQELPKPLKLRVPSPSGSRVFGFQLWINLPSTSKMNRPAYRSIKPDSVPTVELNEGGTVKVVAGKFAQQEGALKVSSGVDPTYLDVALAPGSSFSHRVKEGHTAIVYPFEGSGAVNGVRMSPHRAYVFSEKGSEVVVRAGESGARFLLLAGRPLKESVAWYGPIVMNTWEQIEQAFLELRNGTFVKHREPEFL